MEMSYSMVRIDHWVSADGRERGKMDATLMSVAAIHNLLGRPSRRFHSESAALIHSVSSHSLPIRRNVLGLYQGHTDAERGERGCDPLGSEQEMYCLFFGREDGNVTAAHRKRQCAKAESLTDPPYSAKTAVISSIQSTNGVYQLQLA